MERIDPAFPEYTAPAAVATSPNKQSKEEESRGRLLVIGLVVGGLILLGLVIAAIYFLASPGSPTERIRDIFIIFMALEFLLIGVALVILIVQLATLINLLQNEVKPILESTNETANTLRGTAFFLSEHLTEPVIKMSEYAVAMRRFVELMGIGRKR